jgi:hypothetical protein
MTVCLQTVNNFESSSSADISLNIFVAVHRIVNLVAIEINSMATLDGYAVAPP